MAWRRLQSKLVEGEDGPVSETRVIGETLDPPAGTVDATDEMSGQMHGDAIGRPGRNIPRTPVARRNDDDAPEASSPPEAEARLQAIKRAAARIRRVQKAAVDLSRTYRIGQRVFDPTAQTFGRVIFSAEGYVRLELSDGGASAHGKPPLCDRRAFVTANFQRMDNRTMAEILDISVHTMRRLCHEYGLKRHGKKKLSA